MYIYLTVSLIQIIFFVMYCSCIKKNKQLKMIENDFEQDMI